MGFKIVWTQKALSSFQQRIDYLEIHWTDKETKVFVKRVNTVLTTIAESPLLFKSSFKLKNVHKGLIIKQVSLIYRVKIRKKEIELLLFLDNRQNPDKTNFLAEPEK